MSKNLTLKKFLKILWRSFLLLFLLILAALVFIETPFGQNWIAKQITKRFSKDLKTRISFSHVSFSLLNKLNIQDFLLMDRQNDTLVYAGNLQVRLTDWFVFKDSAELKYVGLENSVIKLRRQDSTWNYQFIVDYFAPSSKVQDTSKTVGIQFKLKTLSLKNVSLLQKDAWSGQDLTAAVGRLQLEANEISPDRNTIDISSLYLSRPLISIYNYPGRDTTKDRNEVVSRSHAGREKELQWNPAGWKMNISTLVVDDGVFKNSSKGDQTPNPYFDPDDMEFAAITAQITNVKLDNDTLSAKLNRLTTKERSGLLVKSLATNVKLDPLEMVFDKLFLETGHSVIGNYFAMRYDDMSDLADFVHKVRMRADFDNSRISSDDIALFAPELGSWKKNLTITGKVKGTVADLSGRGLVIDAGKNTHLNGDVTLSGLPDIDQTFIDFKSNDTRTSYNDVITFLPAAKGITNPDLAKLGNIHFAGSFTGFMHDFVTFGTIRTDLGTITSDLNMKLPRGKEPIYSGNIATTGFQLGKFIHNSDLGLISFSGVVKGHGSNLNTLGADLKAIIRQIDFNGYRYHNIIANGTLEKQLFNGYASVDDPNLQVTLNGLVNINGTDSKLDLVAAVKTANLKALQFTQDSIVFDGQFNLNFTGNNIDNFLGSARITNANLVRNNQRLAFDSLDLYSQFENGIRTLTANSNEFDGTITGDFHIGDLPNAIQLFLNKYYPSYVKAPSEVITHQNFKFSLRTRDVDPFVEVLDSNLKGFNGSRIEGSLDLMENQLSLTARVPQFAYNQMNFNNTTINANGTLTNLSLDGNIQTLTISDSISLPNAHFTVQTQNDSSKIRISTAANQAVTKADLNGSVITYSDGVKINFDTSSFVLNTKTWTIDKGGELSFRSNTSASGEVILHESNQRIRLRTIPSDEGNWNDLVIDMANVNIGDLSPYLSPDNRLEGLLSGSAKIENPGPKMVATGDFKTKFFRYNEDSIGELSISDVRFTNQNDGNLKLLVSNPDSEHVVRASVNIFLSGNHDDNLVAVETKDYQLKFLEIFLGGLFSKIEGYATAKVNIQGNLNQLNYVGKAHLHNAGLKLRFTQVFYKLNDADIELKEHELNLGSIKLTDTLTKGTATISGSIYHDSWTNLNFDLEAKVDSKPITLLNTTVSDNSSFYGHAVGTGSMILVGSENDLYMTVDAKSSEKDSSHIVIPPTKSKASEFAEFLVERTHGHHISDTMNIAPSSKMTYDIALTADPHTTIEVILDEVTGDVVKGRGRGSLNIHSATGEPLTLNGDFEIEDGSYLFTFQSFFKRPFLLRKGGDNFIRWNGDPNKATIHFDAQYTAEKVSFAPLASAISDQRIQTLREDVYVIVEMSGELFNPIFNFKIEFPSSSIATNDPILPYNMQQIENNPNQINKQVTYLIVFNSFAPLDNNTGNSASSASTTSAGGFQTAINELAYNTISSLLFNELNREFSNILAQIFKDNKLKVDLSGSVYNRNLVGSTGNNNFNINASNVNLTLSRALFNDRLIVTAGSTVDIPLQNDQTTFQEKIQFLPDVTTEWLINDKGTVRATFFYRENLNFEPTSTATVASKNKRIGAGISYRKEFNHIGELFHRKKEKKKQNSSNIRTANIDQPSLELNGTVDQ